MKNHPPHKKIRKKMKEETRAKRLRVILKHLTFLWVFFSKCASKKLKAVKDVYFVKKGLLSAHVLQ